MSIGNQYKSITYFTFLFFTLSLLDFIPNSVCILQLAHISIQTNRISNTQKPQVTISS